MSAILAAIWLKETLHKKDDPSDPNGDKEETSYKSLFTPHINAIMFSFAILSLLGGAQAALQPLFCFTPIRDGGLGFSEKNIGFAMSMRSVSTVLVQLLAFPWLQRNVGTLRLYRWLMFLWLPAYIGLPLVNLIARTGHPVTVWIALWTTLLCGSISNMAFVCNLLMTNAAAPSRHLLGAINGKFPFYRQVTHD